MKYNITTIGDASEDIFVGISGIKIEKSPRFVSGRAICLELGEKIPIENVSYQIGGSACNTAVGFARLGNTVSTVVGLGKDTASEKIVKNLIDQLVDCSNIVISDKMNTQFSIIFTVKTERTILIYRDLSDYSVLVPKKGLKTEWVYLSPVGEGAEPIISRLVNFASEKNVKLAWNPGSLQIEKGVNKYKNILTNIRILILNREEGIKFTRMSVKSGAKEIMRQLFSLGVSVVVITDGQRGASAYDGKVYYKIDALNNDRVDATGAGDSFAVGFAGRLMMEKNIDRDAIVEALKWGIINSTSVVNTIGAQEGLLTRHGIEEVLEKNPRIFVEIS